MRKLTTAAITLFLIAAIVVGAVLFVNRPTKNDAKQLPGGGVLPGQGTGDSKNNDKPPDNTQGGVGGQEEYRRFEQQ